MLQSVIFFDSIGFFIIIYNVLNYLFIFYFLFFIFYLIDLKNLNLNSQLFVFEKSNFLTLNFIFIFLSFAGIPPFLGFFSKFIIAGFLIVKSNFFYFFIFLFFNFFVIYFYIQNFKYINTSLCRFQESYPLQINNYWLFSVTIVCAFFNFFFFFFFQWFFFFSNVIFFFLMSFFFF